MNEITPTSIIIIVYLWGNSLWYMGLCQGLACMRRLIRFIDGIDGKLAERQKIEYQWLNQEIIARCWYIHKDTSASGNKSHTYCHWYTTNNNERWPLLAVICRLSEQTSQWWFTTVDKVIAISLFILHLKQESRPIVFIQKNHLYFQNY